MRIRVVHIDEAQQLTDCWLELPAGASVADALAACATKYNNTLTTFANMQCAIFGRLVNQSDLLNDGDRIEVLRPVKVQAIRSRYNNA